MAAPADAASVTGLRAGAQDNGQTRIVLEADGPLRPQIAPGPGASDITLTFPVPVAWRTSTSLALPEGGRAALTGDGQGGLYARVYIRFPTPVRMAASFLIPAKGKTPDRIVIDLASGTKGHSAAAAPRAPQAGILGVLTRDTPEHTETAPVTPERKPVPRDTGDSDPPPPRAPGQRYTVVLDAGHGGKDTGAIGVSKVREKDVTLRAVRILKNTLESTGRYRVFLTRDSDVFIPLAGRVAIARKHKADLFISLHADSLPPGKSHVRGASIYTISDKASDAQTEKLAARENKADLIGGVDLTHEDKDIANILLDLAMRDTQNQSRFLANTIVGQFDGTRLRLLERPHRYAGFAVLKAPDIPSVLVEMGFMSSPQDEKLLSSDDYLHDLAAAMRGATDAYFASLELGLRE